MKLTLVLLFLFLQFLQYGFTENPCAARAIPDQSVVCVCNSTYCDELVREQPTEGQYVAYTSSKGGSRFRKTFGNLEDARSDNNYTLTIDTSVKYQSIEGFGGAVTDAAAISWKNLSSEALKEILLETYFGTEGIQYNMLRIPIGGCDFSPRPYAYNELPENDINLSNFSLSIEDTDYKIPMIKKIMNVSQAPVDIVATICSLPVWMKSNHNITGISYLLEKFYQTYADYVLKFIEEYAKENIPVWAITTTNEPLNGRDTSVNFNTLGWTPEDMGKWIVNNLGPTVRNSTYKNLKILAMDDQRIAIFTWLETVRQKCRVELKWDWAGHVHRMHRTGGLGSSAIGFLKAGAVVEEDPEKDGATIWTPTGGIGQSWPRAKATGRMQTFAQQWIDLLKDPKVLEVIDGVAVHWYFDYLRIYLPGYLLSDIPKKYPGKFVLGTEACEGTSTGTGGPIPVTYGSWLRAQNYIVSILEDLNYDVVGWQDWNLCLNADGGPNWAGGAVDSPIIVKPEDDEFIKQPMFYAMGHFSKFIPRCSKRVNVTEATTEEPLYVKGNDNVAVLTTNDTVVIVIYNDGKERTVAVKLDGKQATLQLEAESVTTVEFPYQRKDSDAYECEFTSV